MDEVENTTVNEQPELPLDNQESNHPLFEKMKAIYPDKELTDITSVMDAALEKINDDESYRTENETANQKLIEVIESEPTLAAVINDVANGAEYIEALARHVDPSDLEMQQGDPDYEKWSANKQERIGKRAEREKFLSDLQANIAASQEAIKSFAEENGMSEEDIIPFLENVNSVLSDAYNGKITTDFLARMYTAENHEKEVQKAAENGVIEGRNQKIDMLKETEMNEKAGDGLPSLTSVSGSIEQVKPTPKKSEVEMIADKYAKSNKF